MKLARKLNNISRGRRRGRDEQSDALSSTPTSVASPTASNADAGTRRPWLARSLSASRMKTATTHIDQMRAFRGDRHSNEQQKVGGRDTQRYDDFSTARPSLQSLCHDRGEDKEAAEGVVGRKARRDKLPSCGKGPPPKTRRKHLRSPQTQCSTSRILKLSLDRERMFV